ncbi:MAG: hypothetical protein ACJA0M_001338 [Chitinophagales bacterium]|jgi:hypothetical protein
MSTNEWLWVSYDSRFAPPSAAPSTENSGDLGGKKQNCVVQIENVAWLANNFQTIGITSGDRVAVSKYW